MEKQTSSKRSVITLLLLFGGLFALFFGFVVSAATFAQGGAVRTGPRVGIVEVKGIIEDARPTMEAIREFAMDDSISGIILRVDSPGGSVGPSQEIYREVVKAKVSKKVVASFGGVAASGGYYAACGADRIVANPGTLTGSVGVITQVAQVEEILDVVGIQTETFKSGQLKDSGSMVRPVSDEDRKLFTDMVGAIHEQFSQTVRKERELSEEAVATIADGRVLTGEQAKELGLVDELGNLYDALGVLQEIAGFEGDPQLVKPKKKTEELLKEFLDQSVGTVGRSLLRVAAPRVEYRLPVGGY